MRRRWQGSKENARINSNVKYRKVLIVNILDLKNKPLEYLLEIKGIINGMQNKTDDDIKLIDRLINRKNAITEVEKMLVSLLNRNIDSKIENPWDNTTKYKDVNDDRIKYAAVAIVTIVESRGESLDGMLNKERKSLAMLEKQAVALSIMTNVGEGELIAIEDAIKNINEEESVVKEAKEVLLDNFAIDGTPYRNPIYSNPRYCYHTDDARDTAKGLVEFIMKNKECFCFSQSKRSKARQE